jgi:DNA-binding LacI/PurR family transcriptional regulator
MERAQPASMQDVAKEAGVSPQTVSRVANGSKAVRPDTRQKVEAAMEKLGYRPNYAARALKHGRFKDIGVVMFNMTTYGNARILNGIAGAAADSGYAITVHTIGKERERTLQGAINRMKQLPVDGVIIILEEHISDFTEFCPTRDLPVVLVCEEPANHCPTIDADQYGCSTAIVDYLLSKGHRTVYHIAGPSSSRAAESRAKGWRDALEQFGIPLPETYIGDWEADSGYQAGLALAHQPDCTAIYAANDQMAYGVIQGLEAAHRRVPDDVSVIGVDDSLVGLVPRLGLTTMRMEFDRIGREAFSMVKRQCEGERVPSGVKTVIPTRLIERSSVRDMSHDDEA